MIRSGSIQVRHLLRLLLAVPAIAFSLLLLPASPALGADAGHWVEVCPIPEARVRPGVVAAGGQIYVIGGREAFGNASDKVYCYDPLTDSWVEKAPLPAPRSDIGLLEVGGNIYAVGGRDTGGNASDKVFCYNPIPDTWSEAAPLPAARSGVGVGSAAAASSTRWMAGTPGGTRRTRPTATTG